jgi:hypothetical protein
VEQLFDNYTKDIRKVLGSDATYTSQLNDVGRILFKGKYHGAYSSDQLPNLTAQKPYAVVNVDNSKQPGSHWLGVCYDSKRNKYLIFDSFGRKIKTLIPSMYK